MGGVLARWREATGVGVPGWLRHCTSVLLECHVVIVFTPTHITYPCSLAPVKQDKDCDYPTCSETCKGESCGEQANAVQLCGPLGCEEAMPSEEPEDSLQEQVAEGALGECCYTELTPYHLLPTPCSTSSDIKTYTRA